jgi:branched-chain amino acid transport system substrate-binding protein
MKKFSFVAISLALFACFTPALRSQAETREIKIGAGLCLSGECAEWGNAALKGLTLAVEEINQSGGILGSKVSLVTEDTAEGVSGAQAIKAFQRLLQDPDIKFIVGPSWSPAGLALIPVLSKKPNIIAITPSMAMPDFARAADNLFKTVPDNVTTATHIAQYAIEKNLKTCAILSNQLAAEKYTSDSFTKEYERLGGKVIELVETPPEESDLSTFALKIVRSNPEVVFLANYVQLGTAAKKLRELGYKGPFISILLDSTRLIQGGEALNGTVFSKYASFSKEFDKKFHARFGESYGPSADSAYDTAYLLREAIQQAATTDPSKVKKILAKLEMQGTASFIRFNAFRTVEKPPLLFLVEHETAVALN